MYNIWKQSAKTFWVVVFTPIATGGYGCGHGHGAHKTIISSNSFCDIIHWNGFVGIFIIVVEFVCQKAKVARFKNDKHNQHSNLTNTSK